jgi:hypothetical protein
MKTHDHAAQLSKHYTMADAAELLPHTNDWDAFLNYYQAARLKALVLRYEDIRTSPFVQVSKIFNYLLRKRTCQASNV